LKLRVDEVGTLPRVAGPAALRASPVSCFANLLPRRPEPAGDLFPGAWSRHGGEVAAPDWWSETEAYIGALDLFKVKDALLFPAWGVVVAPDGATVLAASGFTPHAALLYAGGQALSFQFHPEFERGMAEALVELRRPHLPDAAADRMLASLAAPSDAARVAGWIRAFLDRP